MFPFVPAPFGVAQHSSTVEATSATVPVVWPATPFTVPTVVRVLATTQSYLSINATPAPTATTDMMIAPNVPEFVVLPAGSKIGVLGQTVGTVSFTPLT